MNDLVLQLVIGCACGIIGGQFAAVLLAALLDD